MWKCSSCDINVVTSSDILLKPVSLVKQLQQLDCSNNK